MDIGVDDDRPPSPSPSSSFSRSPSPSPSPSLSPLRSYSESQSTSPFWSTPSRRSSANVHPSNDLAGASSYHPSKKEVLDLWIRAVPVTIICAAIEPIFSFPLDFILALILSLIALKWQLLSSEIASALRLFGDSNVGALGSQRPIHPLILYDIENHAGCKMVREALAILDLDVDIRPCPMKQYSDEKIPRPFIDQLKVLLSDNNGAKNDQHHDKGKPDVDEDVDIHVPYLIDPNQPQFKSKETNESPHTILKYLFKRYGVDGNFQFPAILPPILSHLSARVRLATSKYGYYAYWTSDHPSKALTLYAYDTCQSSRLIRELLCSLQLPYRLKVSSKGSVNRTKLIMKIKTFQLPVLIDENVNPEKVCIGRDECWKHLMDKYYFVSKNKNRANGSLN